MKKQKLPKSEVIKEIIACSDDPIYFINKYCKVQHIKRGLVDFKLYDYQKNAIKCFLANNNVVVNKARQLGFTTLTAAFISWLILFHKEKKVLCVSINAKVSKEMIDKIKTILNNIPDWMYLCDFETNRAHKIVLSNGSSVESVARSNDAGRGQSVALLVIDEAALIRNMDELWKGVKSTTSLGGKIIALSTPKGINNWFHKIYTDARAGTNDWYPLLSNWWENPEYAEDLEDDPNTPGGKTSSWFRTFTSDMTPLQIRQELLTEFLETGDTYFDGATLKFLESQKQDPIRIEGYDKGLWIWKDPNPKSKYLISADCATGAGEDFSTAHIIDLNSLEVVAEYMAKVYPDVFADILIEIGKKYNEAYIAPENANIGSVTCFNIKNSGYKNLVFLNKEFKLVDRWVAEYNGYLPGVPTDVRNRNAMVAKLEEYLRKNQIVVKSARLINELYTFSLINGKAQAAKNCHDDLIMALAIGCWLRDIIPEFNTAQVTPFENIYSYLKVETQTFNNQKLTEAQKASELKNRLKQKGNEYIVNSHIYSYLSMTNRR
jgi:hypothetical protein